MKIKESFLRKQLAIRFGLAALIMPIIFYAMAGTLQYWQGWLYWAVLFIPMLVVVSYFLKADPELLMRRMEYKEKEREQRAVIFLANTVLAAGFLVISYDLRQHGLNQVSPHVVLAADAGVFLGYSLFIWVLKENSYASRTIVKVLLRDLPDYREYCQKRRYRLLPLVW
jgi:hypothetical protein